MKKVALAAAFVLTASTAFAGSIVEPAPEPVIQPEVIVEDTSSSGAGIVVPLLLLVLLAVAAN